MNIVFYTQKYSSASDVLISPEWQVTPFGERAVLFQREFGMTPMEFQREYNAPPENAFLSHDYIYVNGGSFQVEVGPSGLKRDQIERVLAYVKTLKGGLHTEVVFVQHDPQTYQLLSERLWYTGTPEGLREHLLDSPNMTTGVGQRFQTPAEYQYVPQKGGRAPEGPSRWTTERSVQVPIVGRADHAERAERAEYGRGLKFVNEV